MTRVSLRALAAAAALQMLTACVVATSSSGDGSNASFFFLLVPFALMGLMVLLARRRWRPSGRGTRSVGDHGTNEQVLRAELSVLADDVMRLEPHVVLNEAARDDYEAATHRYRVAQAALDYAEERVDLVRVQRVVDEANWSMARVRAVLAGRRPPDPPSSLQRPGRHGEPAVGVDDARHPVYVDSPAEFRSGWFSAGGGLFGGLLLGSLLGSFHQGWVVDEHGDDLDDGSDVADW